MVHEQYEGRLSNNNNNNRCTPKIFQRSSNDLQSSFIRPTANKMDIKSTQAASLTTVITPDMDA